MSGGANRIRLSKADRRKVYEKTRGHCAYCGQEIFLDGMKIAHVFPLRNGGFGVVRISREPLIFYFEIMEETE